MAQRISRAKQTISDTGFDFSLPTGAERTDRLRAVLLERTAPNPFTALNRAVAVAMVHGPDAGLEVIATLAADKRMAQHHRLLAARAHMHEVAGDTDAAAAGYLDAARRATSLPERRYLALQATRLTRDGTARPSG